jgi:predicted  nucleic acid-binding Zn-ribbon protein
MLQTGLIIILLLVDAGLIYAFWQFIRRRTIEADIVSELAEERRMLEDLRRAARTEIAEGQTRVREASDRVSRMALEAEQEVMGSGGVIRGEVEKVLAGFGGTLDAPLAELSARQDQVQALLRKVESEKNVLRKLLARAEMMCKALDEKAPFEEVLSEMREKKYTDARSLLTRGLSVAMVAAEVELSEAEVRLLAGVTATPTKSF